MAVGRVCPFVLEDRCQLIYVRNVYTVSGWDIVARENSHIDYRRVFDCMVYFDSLAINVVIAETIDREL